MCNQLVAETLLVGFRDLKSNKSYAQLKNTYLIKACRIKKEKRRRKISRTKRKRS